MPVKIETIEQYRALTEEQRAGILVAIDTKSRLEGWLARGGAEPPEVEHCPHCDGSGVIHNVKRNDNDIHPSSISKCLKALWFATAGYAQEKRRSISASDQIIFDFGHAWHHWVQWRYGKRGAWGRPEDYYPEVPIDPEARGDAYYPLALELRIRGHIDAIVVDYCLGALACFGGEVVYIRIVHEIKTIKEQNYKNLTKQKKDHEEQATVYSAVTNIPFTSFLYFNKNGGAFCDFNIALDLDLWARLRAKCESVLNYVTRQIPPPWEETSATLSPYECDRCDYKHLCKPYDRNAKLPDPQASGLRVIQ